MDVNRKTAARAKRLRLLAQNALDRLGEVDLDHVPVEQIAEIMGMSRATFFRQVGSKDQVVVLAYIGDADEFAAALPEAVIAPDAPIWPALRQAVEPVLAMPKEEAEARRRRLLLLKDRPTIILRLRRARTPQIEALAAALARQGVAQAAASVLAAAAIAALDRCIGIWATTPNSDLRPLVDQAFFHLARGY